ncbi:MAG: PilZ domain-containing protein [Candidatus Eremiobacteraeota bacterium]|nr:PilZ domain-containing protein [Candidatus Eremiobacteraeota bacterium]
MKVRFLLNDPQTKRLDVLVRIVTIRPLPEVKGFLCVGAIQLPENQRTAIEYLLQRHAPRADLGLAARRSQRLAVSLKTLARELPNFSCLTMDLSLHGARLSCQSAVNPGQTLSLVIESDMDGQPDIAVRGRVIWCRNSPTGRGYAVGVEFAAQSPAGSGALQRFHKALLYRQQGDVQQRQLA